MTHEVLKPFAFSRDGVTTHEAKVGDYVDLPTEHVRGLIAEGFVRPVAHNRETQAFEAAPEHQAFESAPETKPQRKAAAHGPKTAG